MPCDEYKINHKIEFNKEISRTCLVYEYSKRLLLLKGVCVRQEIRLG